MPLLRWATMASAEPEISAVEASVPMAARLRMSLRDMAYLLGLRGIQ